MIRLLALLGILMAALAVPSKLSGQATLPRVEVALFQCDPAAIERDGLLPEFQRLGLAVKRQVFLHPRKLTHPQWQDATARLVWPELRWIKDSGLRLIASGDELANLPWMRDTLPGHWPAVEETAAMVGGLGNCIYLNTVDESSTKLQGWKPDELTRRWRAAGGPPMGWPILTGQSPLTGPHPLESRDRADFTMRQTNWWSRPTLRQRINGVFTSMQSIRRDVPASCLICHGPSLMAEAWVGIACGASVLEVWRYPQAWPEIVPVVESIRNRTRALRGPHYQPIRRGYEIIGRRGLFAWGVDVRTGAMRFKDLVKLKR